MSDAGGDRLDAALAAARIHADALLRHRPARRGPPFDVSLTLDHVQLDGALTIVAFAADVTDQSRSRQQLSYLAYSDTLTGLANRALFADRLHHTLLVSRRDGTPFAVLMVDLDGFKAVNDSLGHDAGDVTPAAREPAVPGLRAGGRHPGACRRR
ncbi:MAG: GGDEF domain-containing protein [Acetobacteraceae bacterium]